MYRGGHDDLFHPEVAVSPEVGVVKRLLCCLAIFADHALAGNGIPLPFEGLYESAGSFAREKVGGAQWRVIAQDVQMRIVKDDQHIELHLLIEVAFPGGGDGPSTYTITNKMWLVKKPEQPEKAKSGKVDLDVLKLNPIAERLEDLGDGYCRPTECRYGYITTKPSHQQRYRSHVTWQLQQVGTGFTQTGDLSARSSGESEWTVYKTWVNRFKQKSRHP